MNRRSDDDATGQRNTTTITAINKSDSVMGSGTTADNVLIDERAAPLPTAWPK
jgi:hypothetical protein